MEFNEIKKYLGDSYQVFGIKPYTLVDGKSVGVEAIDVKTGAGLEFTALKSKCLDISYVSYKGINISFNSKTGIVNPAYYIEDNVSGFLKCFNAGLLTTCGLTYMGAPCIDDGKVLGLHGSIHNTPCSETATYIDRTTENPKIVLKGLVRQSEVFSENLTLSREIICEYGKNKIIVNDIVTNEGFTESPIMLLYHINFGYPMLCEDTTVHITYENVVARDEESQKGIADIATCEAPMPNRKEQCYFYDVKKDFDGNTSFIVKNNKLGISVKVTYNADNLPYLTQWKSMTSGDYALGIEPGTYHPLGRLDAKEKEKLMYIKAGEKKEYGFTLEILDD